MKKALVYTVVILMALLLSSCEEKPTIPVLTTNVVSEISTASAISGGVIKNDGGSPIISKGICWSTINEPTIGNNKTVENGESSSFTSNVNELSPKTHYYVRAYATNSVGTGYGESVTFTTLGDIPNSSVTISTNIAVDSARINGTVNPNSLSTNVTFEWGTSTDYGNSISLENPITGSTSVNVSVKLTNLTPGTTYHYRLKSENILGTTYSSDMTFTTLGSAPTVSIQDNSNLQLYSVTLHGLVNPNYLSTTVNFEWGTSVNYENNVAAQQSPASGNSDIAISVDLSDLDPGTTYHYRITATNELGTTNSSDMTFTTLGSAPSVSIQDETNLQLYSVTLNGLVNPNLFSASTIFEWGITTNYGNTTPTYQNPVNGSSDINVNADLSGLAPGTTYHYRISSTNILGTTVSEDMTFKTLGDVPTTIIQDAMNLQYTTTTLEGSVNPNYLISNVSFEWGTTSNYGNTIVALQSPIPAGTSPVAVSSEISGLIQGTTYHYRISATNEVGTSYSEDLTFTTLEPIYDIEGNEYDIRTIGAQIWMTDNLKSTKYQNGDIILTTSPATLDVSGEATPKYQWAYNGDEGNVDIYGRLYTGYAAFDNRKICPVGWHLPSDADWTILTNYLTDKGYGFEGSGDDIAKSIASKSLWNSDATAGNVGNDILSNNDSGFSALPAGIRMNELNVDGEFSTLGYSCLFWSSTELTSTIAWQRILTYSENTVNRAYSGGKQSAISIRCVKD